MKYSWAIPLGVGLGQVSANIVFPHVQLNCDPNSPGPREGFTGCLRGQVCQPDGTCLAWDNHDDLYPRSFQRMSPVDRSLEVRAEPGLSPDGKCGPTNGGLKCDPASTAYKGTCCSSYGWCGNTPDHCGAGCQTAYGAGCNGAGGGGGGTGTNPPKPSSATGEPALGSPTPGGTNGGVTTDGTCGANNVNTVCGNWPQGSCCSLYGFCGKSAAHCGEGCQSGPCNSAPVAPAPGPSNAPVATNPGSLRTLGDDPQRAGVQAGVPAMHAGLMPNGKVFFLDKVENYTQLKLPNGQFAYSSEYDPKTRRVVPLSYKTNAFCSGGSFLADGRMVSIGGNAPLSFIDPTVGDGFKAIRFLSRSSTNAALDGQSWSEPGDKKIDTARWYASVQTMPDGSLFVASGSLNGLNPTVKENNNPTYEVLNPDGSRRRATTPLAILAKNEPYYMYPFTHLLNNGQVMVFVAKSAEIFDVVGNKVTKLLPDMPGDFRTYPNTGGSVLLPLSSKNNWAPDVMICGGGPYQDITSPTDASCGRIQPLSAAPKWEMDSMPEGRGMVEGTLLPDGTVIWVNGCNKGAQGFGLGADPTKEVLIYDPAAALGQRWHKGPTSPLERLYHSVALLLLDGTLMIAGSNPVEQPMLKAVPNRTPSEDYVTNFKVEIYTPPYLSGANAGKRPTNVVLGIKTFHAAGGKSTIKFNCLASAKAVKVAFYHGGYVTHSVHMSHRMLFLDTAGFKPGQTAQAITVTSPPNRNTAPPGPYVVYVVVDGVPSVGQFVMLA